MDLWGDDDKEHPRRRAPVSASCTPLGRNLKNSMSTTDILAYPPRLLMAQMWRQPRRLKKKENLVCEQTWGFCSSQRNNGRVLFAVNGWKWKLSY